MKKLGRRSVVAIAVMLSPILANAAPILDQSTGLATPGSSGGAIIPQQSIAQTFTVGLEGLLSQIDLQIYQSEGTLGDVRLSVLDAVGGSPGPVLGSLMISLTEIPLVSSLVPWTSIDVSSLDLLVSAGDLIAVELSRSLGAGSPPWVVWSWNSSYSGGSAFSDFRGSYELTSDLGAPGDMSFQTWIESTVSVPEPGTLALLGMGLAGIGFGRRGRGRGPLYVSCGAS